MVEMMNLEWEPNTGGLAHFLDRRIVLGCMQ